MCQIQCSGGLIRTVTSSDVLWTISSIGVKAVWHAALWILFVLLLATLIVFRRVTSFLNETIEV